MRQIRRLALVAAAVSLTAGCASTGGGQAGSRGGSRNLIVAEELAAGGFGNLLDAVRTLRPTWFRQSRSRVDPGDVGAQHGLAVYIDNQRADLSRMESVPVELVKEVRYLDPPEATFRWGTGHTDGAIEVIMKAAGSP